MPGQQCAVLGCGNRNTKSDKKFSFHKFPRDENTRRNWVVFCDRSSDWKPHGSSVICSEHFDKSDFELNFRNELLNTCTKTHLKCGSIPSCKEKTTSDREKRYNIQNRKRIVDECLAAYSQNNVMLNEEYLLDQEKNKFKRFTPDILFVDANLVSDQDESQKQSEIINAESYSGDKIQSNNIKYEKQFIYAHVKGNHDQFEICLLNLIFERPALFDCTLPTVQRSPDVINKLWEEVSYELSEYGTFDNLQLISFWRRLRDSYTRYDNSLQKVGSNSSAILPLPKHADILKQLDNAIDKRRLNVSTETDTSTDICSSDNDFSIPKISKSSITIHSCRTCLNNDGTLSLFEPHNNLLIVDMISDLTNVKVNVAEAFLKTICKSCFEKLYAAFVFKQECKNSEKIMQHFVCQDIASKEDPKSISETELTEIELTETDSYIELDHDTDEMDMNAKVSLQIELVDISEEDKLSQNHECDLCSKSFENEQSLTTHKALIHKVGKPFKCEYVEKIIPLNKSTQQYTEIIEEEKIDLIGISKEKALLFEGKIEFQCNICFKQFRSNGTLNKHKKRHGTPEFICEICSKPVYNKYDLLQHQKLSHFKEKPHKCGICNRCFFSKRGLKMHEFIHTGEKPFKCEYCGKSFRHLSGKIMHTKLHTGDTKRHQCKICFKSFYLPSQLVIHNRVHTGEKPFECQYCNFAFIRKSALTIHLRIHNGIKPYKCYVCDKDFRLHGSLKRHVRIHTGEKPFKCMFCTNEYGNTSNQKTHTNHHCKNNPNRIRKNTKKL